MKITAQMVKELRVKTNAGMMDCKKALLQTDGDMQTAIDYLREKGIMKAAKKAGRVASEGLVFSAKTPDETIGAILEFNSETDFVAKNEDFLAFGNKIVNLLLENDFQTMEDLNSTKLADVTVKEATATLISKIGENMNIRRFQKEIAVEGFVITYIHMGGKIGVLVNFSGEKNDENHIKAKDIAMHIAAMSPDYLKPEDVPTGILDKEKDIMRKQLLEEGKPEKIIDKILIGKVKKYYEENCLLNQKFVKDDKISVSHYAGNLKIQSFTRFKVGEGIEKEETDFAAEVAAQMKS